MLNFLNSWKSSHSFWYFRENVGCSALSSLMIKAIGLSLEECYNKLMVL